jgi:hypothetical protein
VRYKVTNEDKEKFQRNVILLAEQMFCESNKEGETEALDKTLSTRGTKETDIEKSVEEFHGVLELACGSSFRTLRAKKKASTHKAVPWWTVELTIMRKRLNALRRKYQRMRNDEGL